MFSVCGRLMATAGQDHIIRVWVLKNYLGHFTRMRDRYSQQTRGKDDPTMQDFDNFRVHDERVCFALSLVHCNIFFCFNNEEGGRTNFVLRNSSALVYPFYSNTTFRRWSL